MFMIMSKANLQKNADDAADIMTELRRDEPFTLAIFGKICDVLEYDCGDIMTYVPRQE